MNAPDPFALGGRQDGDDRVLTLFRQWTAAGREYAAISDDEAAADVPYSRMIEIEDEIAAIPGGHVALAVKTFLYIRPDFNIWAPFPCLRRDKDEQSGLAFEEGLLRDAGAAVPEIAELAAAIIHEDAELIDADMEIEWARQVTAEAAAVAVRRSQDTEERRQWVEAQRRAAVDRIASVEAKTERGAAIKARHAQR